MVLPSGWLLGRRSPMRKTLGGVSLVAAVTVLFVSMHEGTRHKAYLDSASIPTICVGHTAGVRMGDTATEYECQEFLKQDLATADRAVTQAVKVKINQNQRTALTSLAFNIGGPRFAASTLVRKLNAGDYAGAAQEFPKWNKARVRGVLTPVAGLTKRRLAEQKLFLKEVS